MWTDSVTYYPFHGTSFDFMDLIRNSRSYEPLPQSNGDVMEEFRRNGREVPIDDTPKQWETNFNILCTHSRHNKTPPSPFEEVFPSKCAKKDLWCGFCRNNGESEMIFRSHQLKDRYGNTVCPVLQMYVCPLCKATGYEAHTVKYCPKNPNPSPVALINMLKSHRSEMGRPRLKRNKY